MNPTVSKPAPDTTAKPIIRVVLVEDKPEIRESWRRLIDSFEDFKCVRTYVSGEEAMRWIPIDRPDVVLMDIFLPRMSGIECVRKLKESPTSPQIVMLTEADDDELVFLALEAGADGYLLKFIKPDELRSSLLDVLKGGAPMTSEIARRVVRSFQKKGKIRDENLRLSTREEEVLILLTQGYSNKEIAQQLELSIDTVCTYLKAIYKKMH